VESEVLNAVATEKNEKLEEGIVEEKGRS